jgi:hypothetical protein
MNLEAKQREMRKRYVRKPKARGPRAPKLERGVYVRPVRRDKRVCDFQELRELACQHLRSPRTKTGDWSELFELAVRHGLITTGTPGIHPPESKESEPGPDVRVGESQVPLKEVLRVEREHRARVIKERETNKQ